LVNDGADLFPGWWSLFGLGEFMLDNGVVLGNLDGGGHTEKGSDSKCSEHFCVLYFYFYKSYEFPAYKENDLIKFDQILDKIF